MNSVILLIRDNKTNKNRKVFQCNAIWDRDSMGTNILLKIKIIFLYMHNCTIIFGIQRAV